MLTQLHLCPYLFSCVSCNMIILLQFNVLQITLLESVNILFLCLCLACGLGSLITTSADFSHYLWHQIIKNILNKYFLSISYNFHGNLFLCELISFKRGSDVVNILLGCRTSEQGTSGKCILLQYGFMFSLSSFLFPQILCSFAKFKWLLGLVLYGVLQCIWLPHHHRNEISCSSIFDIFHLGISIMLQKGKVWTWDADLIRV